MKASTMYETLASLLGMPLCAIPLSCCHIRKPYLLKRAGIGEGGTAVLFVIPYLMREDLLAPERNLSLYAVPRDYHGYVSELADTLLPALQKQFPHHQFALFADHSPIDEVDAAARAGLGVLGDNHLLLTPTYGSFVFIAEVVTDADYETVTGESIPDFPAIPPKCDGCGACTADCPAHASGVCLSALTQKKGALTDTEADALRGHDLVWGCDICQLSCPHNRHAEDTPIPYFRENRLTTVTCASLSAMSEKDFATRAFAWRGRDVIFRNTKRKEEEV